MGLFNIRVMELDDTPKLLQADTSPSPGPKAGHPPVSSSSWLGKPRKILRKPYGKP